MTAKRKEPSVPFPVEFWEETVHWPIGERFMGAYLQTTKAIVRYGRTGLYVMSPEQIDHDQPGWSLERIVKALDGLEARGELVRGGGWFFVERVLKRNHPRGRDQIKGALDGIELAPRHSLLWPTFMVAAAKWAPEFHAALDAADRACPPMGGSKDSLLSLNSGSQSGVTRGAVEGLSGLSSPSSRLKGTPGDVRDTTRSGQEDDPTDGEAVSA